MSANEEPDETIFVPRDGEETVVAPRARGRRGRIEPEVTLPADPAETVAMDLDETVMANRGRRPDPALEETIVAPRAAAPETADSSKSGSVAPPVEEPAAGSSLKPRRIRQDALDPA